MTQKSTFEQAKKQVNALKRFYSHLTLFILGSLVLLSLKSNIVQWVLERSENTNPEFLKWVDWNILAIPIIWGAVIVVRGYYVFGYPLIKKWEAQQMKKYLKEGESRKIINQKTNQI